MTVPEIETILSGLPRQVLCGRATPLERMKRMENTIHTGPLYIKRDDLNGVGPGGNKVRPLEYLLGEAVERGSDVVIASGQQNSNLCSIAAAACCRLGMPCILVHNNKKPEKGLENLAGNALLNGLSGVEERYIGMVSEQERNEYVKALSEQLASSGKRPYVIENGATTAVGAVGYIHIGMELAEENRKFKEMGMPELQIQDVFVPGGNGGLAAGTAFGAALLEHCFHVHVITVEHTQGELEHIIKTLSRQMENVLGIQLPVPVEKVMTVYEAYRGEGWGIPTGESDQMLCTVAEREGIFLERTYTSKTMWGMCDLLETGKVKSRGACMIHSGGFASLFGQYQNY